MSSGRINLNVAPSRVKKYRKHSWPSLMVQIQWNPALQPPQSYGHLVIMATFWGPYGKMAIHLLVNLLIWLNFWAYWWPYKWGSTVQCTLYIAPITFPVIAGIENVKMGRGRGLGGREKGRGFLPLPLPLPYPPPPPSHRNRNHTMNQKIFELWAGDELVTCTEDQEICAISGRKGIVWQIINHVISHSLFLCTYYLIEVPAKYSC